MRLSASMSKVNATAQRLPSGQGIGFWITMGSFIGNASVVRRLRGGSPRIGAGTIVPRGHIGKQSLEANQGRVRSVPRDRDRAVAPVRRVWRGAGGFDQRDPGAAIDSLGRSGYVRPTRRSAMSLRKSGQYYHEVLKRIPPRSLPAFEEAGMQERVWGRRWGVYND